MESYFYEANSFFESEHKGTKLRPFGWTTLKSNNTKIQIYSFDELSYLG